ncbi:MAG: DnaB-like helicase N-terminal domain-containing protein [Anaerolineae bacterium]
MKTRFPQNCEAEQSVLGSILIENEAMDAIGTLTPEMFYLERHAWIFQRICELYASGSPIDAVSLSHRLDLAGQLQVVGGSAYLADLMRSVPSAYNVQAYADIVRVEFFKRKVNEIAQNLAGYSHDGLTKTPGDVIGELQQAINELREHQPKSKPQTPATWAELETQIGPTEWVWPRWLPRGHVTLAASEPGMGKSAIGLRLAACPLRRDPLPDGTPFAGETGLVLWVECESAQSINLERARSWGLPLGNIITPTGDALVDVRLDSPDHREAVSRSAHLDDVKFIVVDSLRGSHRGDENSSEVSEVVKWLAGLARDVNKPILLTHHLRKRGVFDSDGISLDRLRGSTAITQYARVVWSLDCPDPAAPEKRRLSVIKSNLGRFPAPLGLTISERGVEFGQAPEPPRDGTRSAQAADILLGLLQKGPVTADSVKKEIESAGLSWQAAVRAKDKLGVVSIKPGGIWHWSLPAKSDD